MRLRSRIAMMASLLALGVSLETSAGEITIDQKDKTFMLGGKKVSSLSIKVGDTVNFKNGDPWFHNIFSLSDVKTFDLGSYPQGQSKSVVFDKSGTAEIECAIHPSMLLKLEVK